MKTFQLVPFTDDHPPDMLDARNTTGFARGMTGESIIRDDDHLRGKILAYDAATIAKMDAGKLELSCGYTCDLDETPGTHPVWGDYDAVQRSIVGNHVALVDKGRAGSASVRMDAAFMVDSDGMGLACTQVRGTLRASHMIAPAKPVAARIEVVVRQDVGPEVLVDPDDLANRNAVLQRSEEDDLANPVGEVSEADACTPMYDDDGNLTDSTVKRIAAASFAVPGRSRLPIHDPAAVKDSMRAFANHEFDDADEKHAAFNRIKSRGAQFGLSTSAFHRANAANLDRKDTAMISAEAKAVKMADKKAKRKAKLDSAIDRAVKAESALADAQGQVVSLTKDLEVVSGSEKARTDAAAEKFDAAVSAKVDLVNKATEVMGAGKVDIQATDIAIMKAVIKHVDGDDVTDTRPGYIEALFEGSIKRARKDAAATLGGANALAAARAAAVPAVIPGADGARTDAAREDDSEAAAAARMKSRSAGLASQPGRMTKDAVMASMNGTK